VSNFEQVRAWHLAFGVPVGSAPQLLDTDRQTLRFSLIDEEFQEYRDAIADGNLTEAADALVDLLYVTYGAMVEHGFPADRLFVEVQRSNMSKLGADGEPVLRDDGKILKGPGFFLPDIDGVLRS
jgi:predicted HAD superfamily Cof-like phosphohydrolase